MMKKKLRDSIRANEALFVKDIFICCYKIIRFKGKKSHLLR